MMIIANIGFVLKGGDAWFSEQIWAGGMRPCQQCTKEFLRFHREEILLHTLTRIARGFTYTVMSGMIIGRDSARRRRGHNCMVRCLDEKFVKLVSVLHHLQNLCHMIISRIKVKMMTAIER